MSLKMIAAILVVIGLVAAWFIPEPQAADYREIHAGTYVSTIHEITLKDGTKCAVVMQYRASGISCNWPR